MCDAWVSWAYGEETVGALLGGREKSPLRVQNDR